MSKKVYQLIVGVSGGVCAIAIALVTYFNPQYAAAINGAIAIGETAVAEACALFVKKE